MLLIELRPATATSVASVIPTAKSTCYKCRMPSASAMVSVANSRRYPHRYAANYDFYPVSTSSSLWQVSGLPGGSYLFSLCITFLPSNKSKFQILFARLQFHSGQPNVEFEGSPVLSRGVATNVGARLANSYLPLAQAEDRLDVSRWIGSYACVLLCYPILWFAHALIGVAAVLGHRSEVPMTMLIITAVKRWSSGPRGEAK